MELFQLVKKYTKKFTKKLTKKRQTNLAGSPSDRSPLIPRPIHRHAASSSSSSFNPSDLDRIDNLSTGPNTNVLLVRHRPTNQLYALKIINGPDEETAREIEILRTVDSPFIVRCYSIFQQGDEIQVLLEYMDEDHIGLMGRVPEPNLANMAYQILQGLTYLHVRKIIHRDIKPTNILINSQNEVKLADFGLSRFLTGEMRVCSSYVGTIKYMSPERLAKEPYDGYASDIWSFGLSVLECYLGMFPVGVQDNYWDCIAYATFSGQSPPEAPADASEKFQNFIKCCLQIEPSERWTAQQLLNHPFITERDGGNAQGLINQNPTAASSSSSSIHRHP